METSKSQKGQKNLWSFARQDRDPGSVLSSKKKRRKKRITFTENVAENVSFVEVDSTCEHKVSKKEPVKVLYQYSREELTVLQNHPLCNKRPDCLDTAYMDGNGYWDPEKWHYKRKNSPNQEDQSEESNDMDPEEDSDKPNPDPRDRVRREQDGIVLSPQRRSFTSGCSVSVTNSGGRYSEYSRSRPERVERYETQRYDRERERDLAGGIKDNAGRRTGSGRNVKDTWDFRTGDRVKEREGRPESYARNGPQSSRGREERDSAAGMKDSTNRRNGNGRNTRDTWDFRGGERDKERESRQELYVRNGPQSSRGREERYEQRAFPREFEKRRGPRYSDRRRLPPSDARAEEPEWFSGGPTSQNDTIELKGFSEPPERNWREGKRQNPQNRQNRPYSRHLSRKSQSMSSSPPQSPSPPSPRRILKRPQQDSKQTRILPPLLSSLPSNNSPIKDIKNTEAITDDISNDTNIGNSDEPTFSDAETVIFEKDKNLKENMDLTEKCPEVDVDSSADMKKPRVSILKREDKFEGQYDEYKRENDAGNAFDLRSLNEASEVEKYSEDKKSENEIIAHNETNQVLRSASEDASAKASSNISGGALGAIFSEESEGSSGGSSWFVPGNTYKYANGVASGNSYSDATGSVPVNKYENLSEGLSENTYGNASQGAPKNMSTETPENTLTSASVNLSESAHENASGSTSGNASGDTFDIFGGTSGITCDFDRLISVSNEQARNGTNVDFDLDDFLKSDTLPAILTTNSNGATSSRFSKFFHSCSENKQCESQCSSSQEEIMTNTSEPNVIIPSLSDSNVYFTPISHAPSASSASSVSSNSTASFDTKGKPTMLMEILKIGNRKASESCSSVPPMQVLESSGLVHSVEDVEARLRYNNPNLFSEAVNGNDQSMNHDGNPDDLAAFRRLLAQVSDGVVVPASAARNGPLLNEFRQMTHNGSSDGRAVGGVNVDALAYDFRQLQSPNQVENGPVNQEMFNLMQMQQQQEPRFLGPVPRPPITVPPPNMAGVPRYPVSPIPPEVHYLMRNVPFNPELLPRPEELPFIHELASGAASPTMIQQHAEFIHHFLMQQAQQLNFPAPIGMPPPRLPTSQELVIHTQTILQNAMLKKRFLEQHENFFRRLELSQNAHPSRRNVVYQSERNAAHSSPGNPAHPSSGHPARLSPGHGAHSSGSGHSTHPSGSGLHPLGSSNAMHPPGSGHVVYSSGSGGAVHPLENGASHSPDSDADHPSEGGAEHPLRSYAKQGTSSPTKQLSSPTPLAFTPTSVLRKMTAEREGDGSSPARVDLRTRFTEQMSIPPPNLQPAQYQPCAHAPPIRTWTSVPPPQRPGVQSSASRMANQPLVQQNIHGQHGQQPPSHHQQQQFAYNPHGIQQFDENSSGDSSYFVSESDNIALPATNRPPPNMQNSFFGPLAMQHPQLNHASASRDAQLSANAATVGHMRPIEQFAESHHGNASNMIVGAQMAEPQLGGMALASNVRPPSQEFNGVDNRDGASSPTSNQLARWFSPQLLNQARNGQLPTRPPPQNMLSLEELERLQQSSSNPSSRNN